ncbi:MAG: hypothetical protein ACNA8W_04095 [Bradymonadaceae bacterium]
MPDSSAYPGMPRWVKVFGAVAFAVILIFVILMVTGGHGPGNHMPAEHPGQELDPDGPREHTPSRRAH